MRSTWRYYPTVWVYERGHGYHIDGSVYHNINNSVMKVCVFPDEDNPEGEELPFPEWATIEECKSLVEVTLRLAHPEWFKEV